MMFLHLLCIAAPFGLYFLPYGWVLAGVGALAIAAALPVLFSIEATDRAQELFISAAAFFAALAVNRQQPMLAYTALSLWGGRRLLNPWGLLTDMGPARFGAVWLTAFAPLALSSFYGDISLLMAALGALAMIVVCRAAIGRIARGSRGMTGEAAAGALLALLAAFQPENLAYLNSPLWGIAYGFFCGFFFFRLGLLNRFSARILSFCGAAIYITAGRELFVFYLFFFAVFEMGKRLPNRFSIDAEPEEWVQPVFVATSMGAAATALISAGASDPFPFFLAIAGAFSAAVFRAWAGWGEYTPRRLLFGLWGSAFLAACGWLSSSYSPGAVPLVMFAGIAAAGAYYARGVLASPENDQRWLEYAFGALSAVFLFNALAAYL